MKPSTVQRLRYKNLSGANGPNDNNLLLNQPANAEPWVDFDYILKENEFLYVPFMSVSIDSSGGNVPASAFLCPESERTGRPNFSPPGSPIIAASTQAFPANNHTNLGFFGVQVLGQCEQLVALSKGLPHAGIREVFVPYGFFLRFAYMANPSAVSDGGAIVRADLMYAIMTYDECDI